MKSVPVRIRTRSEPAITAGVDDNPQMPLEGPLVDAFGRVHRDLRISVTDRCNLRCTYCMPEEGLAFLPRDEILTYEEIGIVAAQAVRLGVRSVRLSGGEPLVRRDLSRLVSLLRFSGLEEIALTTNGTFLARLAGGLREAGLSRINVSCDSLDPSKFASIRRGGDLRVVLASMDAAEKAGFPPVKVNVVVMKGVNEDEIESFADFGRATGRTVRFIEFMPLDAGETWDRESVVSSDEIIAKISARWPLEPIEEDAVSSAPASRFRYLDGGGTIGVIASITKPFCGSCDRLRLTADGNIRNCLFARGELSIRDILRSGGSEAEMRSGIELLLRRSVWAKRAGHGIGEPGFVRPHRTMSMIGG